MERKNEVTEYISRESRRFDSEFIDAIPVRTIPRGEKAKALDAYKQIETGADVEVHRLDVNI